MFSAASKTSSQPAPAFNYIDDVFSTYLYAGTNSNQNIVNGIDLAGKGGMVWLKARNVAQPHTLWDTIRGVGNFITSNNTDANTDLIAATGTNNYDLNGLNANGFSVGISAFGTNTIGANMCSWTFREQPKFFDVVTYSGDGISGRTVSHSLGCKPGMIIIKKTSASADWSVVARRSAGTSTWNGLSLNTTGAAAFLDSQAMWSTTDFTPDLIYNSSGTITTNDNGATYVAYLFAHDAGGFGTTGTDNVISCGSFTCSSGNATINLGYEPQYVLIKRTDTAQNWYVLDVMRGQPVTTGEGKYLIPNTAGAEATGGFIFPTATGFQTDPNAFGSGNNGTYIYMAIRRPMKPPTSGTQVFSPVYSSSSAGTPQTTNFAVDSQWINYPPSDTRNSLFNDRLRGVSSSTTSTGVTLQSSDGNAESTANAVTRNWGNTGFEIPSLYGGALSIYWNFSRRSGFFDTVCYTGTGSVRTVAHNLTVVPELMIVKSRSTSGYDWTVYSTGLGATKANLLNATAGQFTSSAFWNNTDPTSSVFSVGTYQGCNASGTTYVAYLFASVAGVSKVGSYTGTGTTQTINCGFTGGARFVLIKRTDSTGDWLVWDTARGMVSGTDFRVPLNTINPQANNDWVFTVSTGFQIVTTDASVNASGGSYIYLAIA